MLHPTFPHVLYPSVIFIQSTNNRRLMLFFVVCVMQNKQYHILCQSHLLLSLQVILHISLSITTFELISWERCLLLKLPPGSLESLHTMLISVCVCKSFPLYDTSLCAKMYFICFRSEPPNLSDLRPHSQLCWWPARESGTTQPALPMTSPGIRDHTASSAEDQPGSQGPHSQLCLWPALESGTTQPTLLMTSLGVRDHTASSTEDQPGNQGPHSQLCWGPARESDHTANSAYDQPWSQGPHSQLYLGPARESGTT